MGCKSKVHRSSGAIALAVLAEVYGIKKIKKYLINI